MRGAIHKSDWLIAQRCLGMAWRLLRAKLEPPDEAALFRMRQGQEVGRRAWELFPGGVLVEGRDRYAAAARTQALIDDPSVTNIFEAAALAEPFTAKADVLARSDRGWHVIEVKSSFADSKAIAALIDDLAYTVMVFRRSGLPVANASLLLLSREYRFGEGTDKLFTFVDVTGDVLERSAEFAAHANSIADALMRDEPPEPKPGSICRDCAAFGNQCLGDGHAHTVLEIPGLHYKKLEKFAADGIIDLADLPDDAQLNDRQRRAVKAVMTGELCVEDGLGGALGAITWPCHYLDFETVACTLPIYEGHGCHEQVLTQFSIHHRESSGGELRHYEYLADAARDCQRELALALIEALGQRGSIVVYSGFEKQRIAGLQRMFPDLEEPLQQILDRLVDLHRIVGDHVAHPEFHGSFSIKKVLPALVPELSYEGLAIRNGDVAIARFAQMARGEISGEAAHEVRAALLAYCKMDTLAMVRLHERLVEIAGSSVGRPESGDRGTSA
jgi:predicted RecB family nuclease